MKKNAKTATKPKRRTKAQHRSTGRRFTIEQQQEYRSRAQFDDRMTAFGWVVNTKERDHGEDLLIDVYDDGRSTGLSFLAQLKSTDDVERFIPKKDKTSLTYRLDVYDLEHWEVAAQFIVVFVWDVTEKAGVWLSVPAILKQLEGARGWRRQTTVTVTLPRSNGTDDASLHRLRRLVADHNYPIIKRGKTFRISTQFAFPTTPEGIEAANALREALDYGERARIEGKFIAEWKMPPWWERIYGPVMPQEITIAPSASTLDVPARLEVDTPSGTHAVLVDLRRVKAGHHGFTLTNEHQRQPLDLGVIAKREGEGVRLNLHLSVRHPVADIFQTNEATDLLLALNRGLHLRLVHRDTGNVIIDHAVPKDFVGRSAESLREWKRFIDKLCYVQRRIYKHGTIQIRDGRVSRRDARFVEDFYTICQTGCIERSLRFSAEIGLGTDPWPKLIETVRSGEIVEMGFDVPDAGKVKILNVRVPLGRMRVRQGVGAFIDQVARALDAGLTSVRVSVPNMVMREEYPDWAPSTAAAPSSRDHRG